MIGLILVGIITIRDRSLARPAGWLISAGLGIALTILVSHTVALIGGVVTSVGLAWLGYGIWSRPHPAADPAIAPA